MKKIFDTNLKKISIAFVLAAITFLTFDNNFFNEYLVFSTKAATGYRYVYPVEACSSVKTADRFGEKASDGSDFATAIDSESSRVPIYAFTTGAIEKIQKQKDAGSLWLAGQDGYNYLYKGIEEIKVSETSVKTGELIGYSTNGKIFFGITKNGYGEVIAGDNNKESIRKNESESVLGVMTQKFVQKKTEYHNAFPILSNEAVVKQCGENPNPEVTLLDAAVAPGKNGSNKVTLKAKITDPNSKALKISFKLRSSQVGLEDQVFVSGNDQNNWFPRSLVWAKSGTEREYTFENIPSGTYEWSARARNTEGVYSRGIVFGTEGSESKTVSMIGNAYAESSVPSEGWAPVQSMTVGVNEDQVIYFDNFVDDANPQGKKVGSDNPAECCYAVLADANPVSIAPNSGKYVLRINANLSVPEANNNRYLTIYDGRDTNTKKAIWSGPISYGTSGSQGFFSMLIDTAKSPFNTVSFSGVSNLNLRFKIGNEKALAGVDYSATTFYVASVEITKIGVPTGTTTTTASTTTKSSPPQKVVTLDPGHPSEVGSGAAGEIELNWQVAGKLRQKLSSMGYKVVMTKSSMNETVTNKRRAEIANENNSSLFFRIHADDSSTSRGYFFMTPDKTSSATGLPTAATRSKSGSAASDIAAAIQDANLGLPQSSNPFRSDASGGNAGSDPNCQGLLVASCYSKVPTTLIEMGELKTADKAWLVNSTNQDKLAAAMANGISAFLGGPAVTASGSTPSCSFTQSSYSLNGPAATLTYGTIGATSAQLCSASGNCKTATVGTNQTVTASPSLSSSSTVYTLKVSNGTGEGNCTTIVTNSNPSTTITTKPPTSTSCGFDRSKLAQYEAAGTTDPCSKGTTAGPGSCYVKSGCQDVGWVLGSEGRQLAASLGALGQSDGIAGDKTAVNNLIRAEIAQQFSDLTSENRALAQKVMIAYAFLEDNNYYKFFNSNGSPRYYFDDSGTCLDYFSLTSDKFCTKKKRAAASYDIKYATYLAIKEFRSNYVGMSSRPTTLQGWKNLADKVFGSSFWDKNWGYGRGHGYYLENVAPSEVAYSCQPEKPNNAPNVPVITDVVSGSDIITVLGVGADVTLKTIASDPDNDKVSVKFRLYKYDEPGKTPAQYCSTLQESAFDGFLASGSLHTYTFKNLAPGTYKWSAMANDEHYRKSEGGSMFCYSSSDPTKELYGFATARVFTVDPAGNINQRPYLKTNEMTAAPAVSGTAVSLNVKGYDNDGDKVQAYYRVREKITGNCTIGGSQLFQDSDWSTLKDSGSEHPYTMQGLKPGTTYQWSVKLQDEEGMLSRATTDGLSFCGGDEWYPALEFSTPAVTKPSCEFTKTEYQFVTGNPVTLTYSTQNANSAEICSSAGNCKTVNPGTGINFAANPTVATVYTLSVKDLSNNTGSCTTKVTPSATTTTGSTTTTSTKPGITYTRIQTWDYCKDSALAADCPSIFTNSSAIPFFDPEALDVAHKLNAFFVDLAAVGSIGAVPSETSFITLDPGTYQFRVRAATDNSGQNIRLSVENASGTIGQKENVALGGGSGSNYGTYVFEFTLAQRDSVRLRMRKNDTSKARIMVDRYDIYKAQ